MIENEITDRRGDFLEFSLATHRALLQICCESGPTPAVRHITWWAAQEMHRIREAVSSFDHDLVLAAIEEYEEQGREENQLPEDFKACFEPLLQRDPKP